MNADLYTDEYSNDDCDFVDDVPIERFTFHLRITGERDALKLVAEQYVKQYKPVVYAFSYEEVDDNHHIHGHLEYTKVPTKQSISQWMKTKGFAGKYYHQDVKTTSETNLIYICKDLDIIYHNLTDKHLTDIKSKTQAINENKKMDQRHKLLIEYNNYLSTYTAEEMMTTLFTLPGLARWIMYHYINKYDKEPPLAHIKGYTIYIASKCLIREKYQNNLDHLFDNLF